MNTRRYVTYRIGWTLVGMWAALSGIFVAYALTPDPNQYMMGGGRAGYRAVRNMNAALLDRYLTWFQKLLTLDLGTTVNGEPIVPLVTEAAGVTLAYLGPSLVLALVLGVGVGLFAAIDRDNLLVRAVRSLSYAGFAVPTLVAAEVMFLIAKHRLEWFQPTFDPSLDMLATHNLLALSLPAFVVTLNLLAVQFRYARSESVELVQQDFVRTLRASGADTRDLLEHLFRNAAASLLALFVSEMVGVLFVVLVIVEVIFGVPGFGALLYRAIRDRDFALITVTTLLPIVIVMVGNLVQDVTHAVIDPRVAREGSE